MERDNGVLRQELKLILKSRTYNGYRKGEVIKMTRIEFISDNGIRFVISKDTQKVINNVIHTA